MRPLLTLLLSAWAATALAQDCVPRFYEAEPRDAEWFYGAGKGADAAAARDDALRRLAIKAAGGKNVLPDDALAGWEQDDHGECAGVHYALARIEQERVRRNLAARRKDAPPSPAPAPSPQVVNNNIANTVNNVTVAPPSVHPYLLLVTFLCFAVACLAFVSRRPQLVSYFYRPPGTGAARAAVSTAPSLSERFTPVARQTQKEAVGEIARLGVPEYFRVHKGEGTCRPVPGAPDLLQAGVLEMLRPYAAGGWKVSWEGTSGFAYSVKDNLVMGFGFFLYASDEPGSTDCEILYAITAPIDDAYRNQMEEGLHQGLPWAVQAAAGRQGASRSA